MVEEKVIDAVAEELERSPAAFEETLQEFGTEQPMLLAYLFSEEFEAFTPEERDLLLFLALVIWRSVQRSQGGPLPKVTEEDLARAEERNWEKIEEVATSNFRARADVLFSDYAEEDLLALAEDALTDDDEPGVTSEAREPLFVSLKTIIDTLTAKA